MNAGTKWRIRREQGGIVRTFGGAVLPLPPIWVAERITPDGWHSVFSSATWEGAIWHATHNAGPLLDAAEVIA